MSRLGAVSVFSDGFHGIRDKSVGDLEIAFTRGRRVVHRTQIQVGESAGYTPLLFWEEARRGFMSVRGEQITVGLI